MTLSTPTRPASKTERRQALETPHQRDHEASVERAMSRGVQPKGLPQLVAWFREACHDEAPQTIHKNDVWRDYGHDGSGGSLLGTRAWSEPFRRFIEAVDGPNVTDEDGRYRFPLRAALARMARGRYALTAQHLFQLALLDGDYRRHAENVAWQYEEMEVYMTHALYLCWREYSDVRLRT